MNIENMNALQLRQELYKQAEIKAKLIEALEKLARLGNEPHYGNSIGNEIAKKALSHLGG